MSLVLIQLRRSLRGGGRGRGTYDLRMNLTHLYVVCPHFILSSVPVLRPCRLLEFH